MKIDTDYDSLRYNIDESMDKLKGKIIKKATHHDQAVELIFEDGTEAAIYDDGQSCCESRYLTAEVDDMKWLAGKEFKGLKSLKSEYTTDEWEVHETVFVEILTNEGSVPFRNHNEHNGYYGGFSVAIKIKE